MHKNQFDNVFSHIECTLIQRILLMLQVNND